MRASSIASLGRVCERLRGLHPEGPEKGPYLEDGTSVSFKPGDRVVYPHHGAAVIEKKEKRKAFGEETEYLSLIHI